MTTEFNLTSSTKLCLVGNWREDGALLSDGLKARISGVDTAKVDSFERVMPRCRESSSAKHWQTQTRAAMASGYHGGHRPSAGPLSVLRAQQVETEAAEYVKTLRPGAAPQAVRESEFTGTMRHWDEGYYRAALAGRATEAPLDATTGAAAFGVTGDISPYVGNATYYGSDAAITALSARAVERIFPGGGHKGSGAASELSLALLFTRLVRRLAGAGSSPAQLLDLLRPLAEVVEDVPSSPRRFGSAQPGVATVGPEQLVPTDVARKAVHGLRLALPDIDLEAILSSCEPAHDGRLSLGALERQMAAVRP